MTETNTAAQPLPKEQGSWFLPRLITVWLFGALLGLTAALFLPADQDPAQWLVLAIGLVIVVTFVLQIGTAQKEGFIARVAFSIAGGSLLALLIVLPTLWLGGAAG